MRIEFGDDTFDAERRIMRELQGYTLAFTMNTPSNSVPREITMDVVYFGYRDGRYLYRYWDDDTEGPVGKTLEVDPVDLISVHVY